MLPRSSSEYQSYIPSILGRSRDLAGNSSLEMVRASGQVVGPGIGGALVALLGAASVILVQSVTFAGVGMSGNRKGPIFRRRTGRFRTVEPRGIEPLTSCLQSRRSTN